MITPQQQATLDWLRATKPTVVAHPAVTLVYLQGRGAVIHPNGSYCDVTLGLPRPAPNRRSGV